MALQSALHAAVFVAVAGAADAILAIIEQAIAVGVAALAAAAFGTRSFAQDDGGADNGAEAKREVAAAPVNKLDVAGRRLLDDSAGCAEAVRRGTGERQTGCQRGDDRRRSTKLHQILLRCIAD